MNKKLQGPNQMIKVTVQKHDPDAGRSEERVYEVPFEPGMTALMALKEVQLVDGVALRHSCDIGLCSICTMNINGKTQLACKLVMHEPVDLVVAPVKTHPMIRDLVTEMDSR